MRAIVQDTYGGTESLRLTELPDPVAGPGQALVEVRAASVNAADWHMMRGDPWLARLAAPELGWRRPKLGVRGRDFAGVVRAVGAGVTELSPGTEVYGELPQGGTFAELVVADAGLLARKPASLDFVEAAAVPLAGVTALMAVRDRAGVTSGQRVLLLGASGGVGTFALQLAVEAGAEATAVCSTRQVALARELGAHEVIDHTSQDVTHLPGAYDAVIVVASSLGLTALRRLLAPGGALVLVSGDSMAVLARAALAGRLGKQRIEVMMASPSRAHLDDLRDLIEAGRIRPVVDSTYPLERAAEAIDHIERGGVRGKIVVAVASQD